MSYENRLNTVYTQHLQFKKPSKFWKKRSIPKGQILYHKKNFSKYFGLPIKNFKTKKILETGARRACLHRFRTHGAQIAAQGKHRLGTKRSVGQIFLLQRPALCRKLRKHQLRQRRLQPGLFHQSG